MVFRDCVITAGDEFTKEDFLRIYSPKRLIRSEFSVLIGLMLKAEIDIGLPDPSITRQMIERSDLLMEELHQAVLAPAHNDFRNALQDRVKGNASNPLSKGAALREAMFYSGESAFSWHYLNFARLRYANDAEWLLNNRGFTIDQAVLLAETIVAHLSEKLMPELLSMQKADPRRWTMLPLFSFTREDLVEKSGLSESVVDSFLESFSVKENDRNHEFHEPFSRNTAKLFPILPIQGGQYTSFMEYSTTEAMYESPFYWMISDRNYRAQASKNRGNFAEDLCHEILNRVFRDTKVYRNVTFRHLKGLSQAEADTIVVFGSRAFVFQVKSKRLTEKAKSGDELSISNDFKSAIQHAYDQAISCIEAMRLNVDAMDENGPIIIDGLERVADYFPVCITSENYPALTFQVAQFLKTVDVEHISSPLVFDLFTLDIIAEFLESPLYFLDYLSKRSKCHGKISSSHEMVILSYHLKNNLYIPDGYDFMMIEDDFLVDLDLAVNVRRRGIPGRGTPEGILTRSLNTPLGKVLNQINESHRPEIQEIGEVLLGLSGDSFAFLDSHLNRAIALTQEDGNEHDVSIPLDEDKSGLTIHCNLLRDSDAARTLVHHCEIRKYTQRADRWYGLSVTPIGDIRLAIGQKHPWKLVPALEGEIADFKARSITHWVARDGSKPTVGRNDSCPCGSGKKYKRCHGDPVKIR